MMAPPGYSLPLLVGFVPSIVQITNCVGSLVQIPNLFLQIISVLLYVILSSNVTLLLLLVPNSNGKSKHISNSIGNSKMQSKSKSNCNNGKHKCNVKSKCISNAIANVSNVPAFAANLSFPPNSKLSPGLHLPLSLGQICALIYLRYIDFHLVPNSKLSLCPNYAVVLSLFPPHGSVSPLSQLQRDQRSI